jgi:glycosyltransferase involved in cell wall biosynthesis
MEDLVGGPEYSLVLPACDEAETIPELLRRLHDVLDRLDGSAEVVFVDDGSVDATYDLLADASRSDPRFRVVQLSRNFGHQAAITAGLEFARGRAAIIMDADLQDPPEVILELAAKWREGYEVVYAVREDRPGDSVFKRASASVFYAALRRMSDIDVPVRVGDFRLVDRRALEAFLSMRESNRYVRGMFGWIGFRQVGVPYRRDPRYAGRSKYGLRKMFRLAFDGLVGFSTAPLRMALKLGFALAALSLLSGIAAIALKLAGAYVVPGWASLTVAVTFLGGVQLWMIGVMGEYVGRIQDEVRQRPLYIVRQTEGFTPRVEEDVVGSGPAAAAPPEAAEEAGGSVATRAVPAIPNDEQ